MITVYLLLSDYVTIVITDRMYIYRFSNILNSIFLKKKFFVSQHISRSAMHSTAQHSKSNRIESMKCWDRAHNKKQKMTQKKCYRGYHSFALLWHSSILIFEINNPETWQLATSPRNLDHHHHLLLLHRRHCHPRLRRSSPTELRKRKYQNLEERTYSF